MSFMGGLALGFLLVDRLGKVFIGKAQLKELCIGLFVGFIITVLFALAIFSALIPSSLFVISLAQFACGFFVATIFVYGFIKTNAETARDIFLSMLRICLVIALAQ